MIEVLGVDLSEAQRLARAAGYDAEEAINIYYSAASAADSTLLYPVGMDEGVLNFNQQHVWLRSNQTLGEFGARSHTVVPTPAYGPVSPRGRQLPSPTNTNHRPV